MPIENLTLVGAGGHAKVVLDAVRRAHPHAAVQIYDEAAASSGGTLLGVMIYALGPQTRLRGALHVAIGDAPARERIARALQDGGSTLVTIVHPAASIAASARIGEGSFVAAHAVVAPSAVIGEGAIVNHGAVVDHDCAVGDWAHIAPNATLGGNAAVGRSALIGAGATVLPGVRIGAHATVGAGAVVAEDVPPHATVIGIPAKAVDKS
jgi:sugar O-acyltransferase (sialic acid O-acetyltransferase NeuD family)